jgi:hypothetical protein
MGQPFERAGRSERQREADILMPAMRGPVVTVDSVRWLEFGDTVRDRSAAVPWLAAYAKHGSVSAPHAGNGSVGDLHGHGCNDLMLGACRRKAEPGTPPVVRIDFASEQDFIDAPIVIPAPKRALTGAFGLLGVFDSVVLDINDDKATDLFVFWEAFGYSYRPR